MVAEQRLAALERAMAEQAVQIKTYTASIDSEKRELMDQLNAEFDRNRVALVTVVNGAREEFLEIKKNLGDLYGHTADAFHEVRNKVNELEATMVNFKGGTSEKNFKGYLPTKNLVPKMFGNIEEEWRKWQDDVMDYMDTQRPGMRAFLKKVEAEPNKIDEEWIAAQSAVHPPEVVKDKVNVYRALKGLTEGEARMVVQAAKEENGFDAWKQLHQRFGLSLAAKQGKVMCDVSGMVAKPAKSPAETRSLVTELERRVRVAEEVTGTALNDGHIKSILASFLDNTTRAHTSQYQGTNSSYADLKRAVLEFCNNNIAVKADPDAMAIGRIEAEADTTYYDEKLEHSHEWENVHEHIAAVSAHTQCFRCHGYGHMSNQCPTQKGKGKGGKPGAEPGYGKAKGKGWFESKGSGKSSFPSKGGGKAKGKGPRLGCWTCGGQHFASECPNQGKGKGGGKGIHAIEEWPTPNEIRCLSTLSKVKVVPTQNRFSVLAEAEDDGKDGNVQDGDSHAGRVDTTAWSGYARVSQSRDAQKKDRQGFDEVQKRSRAGSHCKGHGALGGKLSPLQTIEPESVCAIGEKPEWEIVEFAVDSGASETVIPENAAKSVRLTPSEASVRGVMYEVANGERIPNLGEKVLQGYTDGEGLVRQVKAQVCEVNKPLLSVHKLVQAGNNVVFNSEGAYIEDKTNGERVWLRESGGMYMAKMWIPTAGF